MSDISHLGFSPAVKQEVKAFQWDHSSEIAYYLEQVSKGSAETGAGTWPRGVTHHRAWIKTSAKKTSLRGDRLPKEPSLYG